VRWSEQATLTVFLTSSGYPGTYETGKPIDGLDDVDADIMVFHSGTKRDERGQLLTAGGRVLAVTAIADTLEEARAKAYDNARRVRFEGVYYRSDIGANAMAVPA
jgi:phosphoribosylamine--glycine ligase